jgi:hypothetical protein
MSAKRKGVRILLGTNVASIEAAGFQCSSSATVLRLSNQRPIEFGIAGPWSQRVLAKLFSAAQIHIPMDTMSSSCNYLIVRTPRWRSRTSLERRSETQARQEEKDAPAKEGSRGTLQAQDGGLSRRFGASGQRPLAAHNVRSSMRHIHSALRRVVSPSSFVLKTIIAPCCMLLA